MPGRSEFLHLLQNNPLLHSGKFKEALQDPALQISQNLLIFSLRNEGDEPWLKGIERLGWQTFFRVCTEEMDDLSLGATKLVIEYCLAVVEQVEGNIRGKITLPRLEAALEEQYDERNENQVYHYRWARRHPVVNEALTKALANRFPPR